jgi:hypothetical protein
MPAGTCAADSGNACDDCESQWCCTQHLACYQDPTCACVDQTLDHCLDDAGPDASTAGPCWDSFASAGAVEAARVACLKAWCGSQCGVR